MNDQPPPPESLTQQWLDLKDVRAVDEGNRNWVWKAQLDGQTVAVRRSRRSSESLDWELDLIEFLDGAEFVVPSVIPTDAGERHWRGFVVQRWIDGTPPTSKSDWQAVAQTLKRLHSVTAVAGLQQRPGCKIVTELGPTDCSLDADLSALPEVVAAEVLSVFAAVRDAPVAVIHGDPGPSNLRMGNDGAVALLDFDESRVDVIWHDLSNLGVEVLSANDHRRALDLSDAWETANGWQLENSYAGNRLQALLSRREETREE